MTDWMPLFTKSSALYWVAMTLLGLCVGSFLTVVITRSPAIINAPTSQPAARLPLLWPRSQCCQCKSALRWFDLIPILSAIWLHGRCRICQTPFGWRYTAIELSTLGLTLLWVSLDFAGPWLLFFWWLLALAWIDAETQLLPDDLTLSLLWFGLLSSALGWVPTSMRDSILGAALGYVSLWCVLQSYWYLRRQEGLGYGDLKLLAALGAWLGWMALPWLVLVAALGGLLMVLVRGWQQRHQPVALGPALAGSAALYWLWTQGLANTLGGFNWWVWLLA